MILRAGFLFVMLGGTALAEDYPCLIEPRQTLKLTTPVQGVVGAVLVDRGDRVRKGQLVARLDTAVEEANVLIARLRATNDAEILGVQSKLEFLRRKLARKDRLQNNTFGSQQELEEAQSDVKVAEAQLRGFTMEFNQAKLEATRAEGLLRQRQILSPVNGVVTERALGEGEYVNDQAHVLTIAEIDPLRVETFLPISVYRQVKVGDIAEVMPESPVGGSYKAKVMVVDQVFNAASRTIGVRLELANPDLQLPAGVHCQLRLAAPS
jgi:RND family efflux transporter MFP subunit